MRSLSDCRSMSIQLFQSFKKLFQDLKFFAGKQNQDEIKPELQWTLGNMTIVLIVHDRWPVSIWSFQSFTSIMIAEAITGIEPDPIPVVEIAGIFTIVVIIDSDVSI